MKTKTSLVLCFMIIILIFMLICAQSIFSQTPKPGGDGGDFIKRFDKDNDGRVSMKEFHGPDQRFNRLDKNNDGYIDKSEVPPRARRGR